MAKIKLEWDHEMINSLGFTGTSRRCQRSERGRRCPAQTALRASADIGGRRKSGASEER